MKAATFIVVVAVVMGAACAHETESEALRRGHASELKARVTDGDVRIDCDVGDAEVYVDGVIQGQASDFDGKQRLLKTGDGAHAIQVRKTGYQVYEAGVVAEHTMIVLMVHLIPL
jgi:hypothetical protein